MSSKFLPKIAVELPPNWPEIHLVDPAPRVLKSCQQQPAGYLSCLSRIPNWMQEYDPVDKYDALESLSARFVPSHQHR